MKEPSTPLEHLTVKEGRPKTREYVTTAGNTKIFDITREVCEPFGFYPGDRVATPNGAATVIGVSDDKLWFLIDGRDKVSFYGPGKKEDYEKLGFRLLTDGEDTPTTKDESAEKPRTREYHGFTYDISREACEPFGFFAGDRVQTPNGPETVFGVREGDLWFLDDGKTGITEPGHWGNKETKEYYERREFRLISSEEDSVRPKTREYPAETGGMETFDISREACEPFGFYPGERVETPLGCATVIGVYDETLWYHVDGRGSASRWQKGAKEKKLRSEGFRLITDEQETPVTEAEKKTEKPKTREYQKESGTIATFDISREVCEPFGFFPGERIVLPGGYQYATVIGVREGTLWFQIDGAPGAVCWSDEAKSKKYFEDIGFRLLPAEEDAPPIEAEKKTEEPEQENDKNMENQNEQKQELFPGIAEDETSVSYLGVRLPKAENTTGPFVPKRETYDDYINESYSLELQKKIAISFLQGDPMLVEGGTSIGKTTTVKKMCADLGWEVHYINVNGLAEAEDFMGKYVPNVERANAGDSEYVFADGKMTSGIRQEEGKIKVVILDEYNAAKPNILIRIHEILDAIERDSEVVLSEDASESLSTNKKKTKIIALINPPGRGFLAREPLDPAQLRRWVYDKEPTDLPDNTFSYSTEALFGLSSGDELQPKEAFLAHPDTGISIEQLAEIPGMNEMLLKYQEFHKAAKKLLKERKLASDQPQPFTFDDRMEPRRVRDFIARFFTGDINAVFQEALRYYYVNKLEKPDDRAKLNELIATVCYIPPKEPSKRKSLGGDKPQNSGPSKPTSVPDSGPTKDEPGSSEKPEVGKYKSKTGDSLVFDVSREACKPFGFYPGERVETPSGLATVLGKSGADLWFHFDTDEDGIAATYYPSRSEKEFKERGIRVISGVEEASKAEPKKKETLEGRDPEEFLNKWFEYTSYDRGSWKWDISADGKIIDMITADLPLEEDTDKKETLIYKSGGGGIGLDALLEKLKGKNILSVNNNGSWFLEVVEPETGEKETTEKPETREYPMMSGMMRTFEVSRDACEPFGFYPGDRVQTPSNGPATVIGVSDNKLWFHMDNERGAAFFSSAKKADMEEQGFRLIQKEEETKPKETPAPRDPEEFLIETIKQLQEGGTPISKSGWNWCISEDGKMINMQITSTGIREIDKDGVIDFRYGENGTGFDSLLEKLKGKKILSVNSNGVWFLEIVD